MFLAARQMQPAATIWNDKESTMNLANSTMWKMNCVPPIVGVCKSKWAPVVLLLLLVAIVARLA